jgi:penicillin-binding protein 1A
VARFAYSLGIETTLSPYLSLALGASEVTLIDLTSAYAVFANMGKGVKPYGVREVIDQNGRILWRIKPRQKVAMSQAGAAIIANMLESVILEGTGKKARVLKRPVAGKTGTTNEYKDALFIGFTPSIAAGVWVGQDRFRTIGKGETGARAALPIWIDFMKAAHEDKPYQDFDIPDDVIRINMNPTTGTLESGDSSNVVTALFKKGTEPIQ